MISAAGACDDTRTIVIELGTTVCQGPPRSLDIAHRRSRCSPMTGLPSAMPTSCGRSAVPAARPGPATGGRSASAARSTGPSPWCPPPDPESSPCHPSTHCGTGSAACWLPAVSRPSRSCLPHRASLPGHALKVGEAPPPATRSISVRHAAVLTVSDSRCTVAIDRTGVRYGQSIPTGLRGPMHQREDFRPSSRTMTKRPVIQRAVLEPCHVGDAASRPGIGGVPCES